MGLPPPARKDARRAVGTAREPPAEEQLRRGRRKAEGGAAGAGVPAGEHLRGRLCTQVSAREPPPCASPHLGRGGAGPVGIAGSEGASRLEDRPQMQVPRLGAGRRDPLPIRLSSRIALQCPPPTPARAHGDAATAWAPATTRGPCSAPLGRLHPVTVAETWRGWCRVADPTVDLCVPPGVCARLQVALPPGLGLLVIFLKF